MKIKILPSIIAKSVVPPTKINSLENLKIKFPESQYVL